MRRISLAVVLLLALMFVPLVELKVDIICSFGTPATLAVQKATKTIPIVFGQAAFPERTGVARTLQVTIDPLGVHDRASLDGAFDTIRRGMPDALMTTADPVLQSYRTLIAEFTAERRLPSMHGDRDYVTAGGLMVYGTSMAGMWRHAAIYVDRILKGAKPGDLPVEQPTNFDLVINMKTAKTLGLTIPHTLLLRATQVIE